MNINIKATGFELTEAIRDYVNTKLGSVEKVIKNPDSAYMYVEVGKESDHHQKGDVYKAEVKVDTAGQSFYAVEHESDLYAAIDEVKDEILEKIKGDKDKQISRVRRGGRMVKDFIKGFLK